MSSIFLFFILFQKWILIIIHNFLINSKWKKQTVIFVFVQINWSNWKLSNCLNRWSWKKFFFFNIFMFLDICTKKRQFTKKKWGKKSYKHNKNVAQWKELLMKFEIFHFKMKFIVLMIFYKNIILLHET